MSRCAEQLCANGIGRRPGFTLTLRIPAILPGRGVEDVKILLSVAVLLSALGILLSDRATHAFAYL